MKAPAVVLRTFEGALLILFGGMLLMMVDSGSLWYFINPKFSWLIATGGAGLFALGLFVPFAEAHKAGLGRMAVLCCFLLMAGVAREEMRRTYAPPEADDVPGLGEPFEFEPAKTHLEINGHEYLKLNEAELFALADKEEPPERVVFRGMVRRNGALGKNGQAAVIRVVIVCCLADAVAVGFRVRDPALEELPDGSWIRVAGRLKRLKSDKNDVKGVTIPGVVMTVINDQWLVEAEQITPIDPPEMPFIFDIRPAPPYAY